MGIIRFKIFIWGGISSDIQSEIKFYGSAHISRRQKSMKNYPVGKDFSKYYKKIIIEPVHEVLVVMAIA